MRKCLLVKVLAKERAVGQGPCLVRAFRSFFSFNIVQGFIYQDYEIVSFLGGI